MRYIVTVVGIDKVGIIAKVCTYLSAENANILDISQTIIKEFFNMIMIVEFSGECDFEKVTKDLESLSAEIGVKIKIQSEELFKQMHRI